MNFNVSFRCTVRPADSMLQTGPHNLLSQYTAVMIGHKVARRRVEVVAGFSEDATPQPPH